jgi:predicted MPP superfamily phosphohydrolase
MEQRAVVDPPRPAFDVLVVAGDVSDLITRSIGMVAALAAGKPAVFVAGNHEWWGDERSRAEKLTAAHASARQHGVHFLECDAVDIAGVRFAGATLWTPDDPRFVPSVVSLAAARADVIVTHFEPTPAMIAQVGGELWIYGHHHGHGYRMLGNRRIIRNGLGYPNEPLYDGLPAIADYTIQIGERR